MASPWPGMVEAHLDTACTLNTACGAAEIFWTSSVLMRPGDIKVFQTLAGKAVVSNSFVFFLRNRKGKSIWDVLGGIVLFITLERLEVEV